MAEQSASAEVSVDSAFVSGGASLGFSGSQAYNSFKNDVVDNEKTRITMTSFCLKYVAGLNKGKDADLTTTPYFTKRAKQLPVCMTTLDYCTRAVVAVERTVRTGRSLSSNEPADLLVGPPQGPTRDPQGTNKGPTSRWRRCWHKPLCASRAHLLR